MSEVCKHHSQYCMTVLKPDYKANTLESIVCILICVYIVACVTEHPLTNTPGKDSWSP